MNIDKLNNEELTHFVITGEIKGGCVEAQVFSHFSYVGRNKPVRATARTGVAYMDVGKGREQERKLFRQTPSEFAGNATSRYALGWPYSGLRLGEAKNGT